MQTFQYDKRWIELQSPYVKFLRSEQVSEVQTAADNQQSTQGGCFNSKASRDSW